MKSDPTRKWIRRASTAAGLAYTAIAEYELARRLGARPPIAVMLPLSLDCYVIAALKWFRAFDVALSLILMCAAQIAAHALEAGVVKVSLNLVTVVSVLVPVALWRTHALARGEHETPAEPTKLDVIQLETSTEVERVPEAYPAIEAPVPAVPEAVPAGVRLLPIVARPEASRQREAFAAEPPRTRDEVHEYVPEPPEQGVPEDDEDPLTAAGVAWAAEQFKGHLLDGHVPSIRDIKAGLSVGQDRAKEIQDAFREALPKLTEAGVSS